jgi:hypothetical protein
MMNPNAATPVANNLPPSSLVIRHTKTSVAAPASEGKMWMARSDSPNSTRLKACRKLVAEIAVVLPRQDMNKKLCGGKSAHKQAKA